MLRVETGFAPPDSGDAWSSADVLDYRVYSRVPRWWRWIETLMRMDLWLAIRAARNAGKYEIVWAGSEKVAIPLSIFCPRCRLVTIIHYPESKWRARFLRWTRMPARWAGLGYVSPLSRDFMIRFFGVPPERLFQYFSVDTEKFAPDPAHEVGSYVMSAGVAKRDYSTLFRAMEECSGDEIRIYAASRYGDRLRADSSLDVPSGISFLPWVSEEELVSAYQRARFVVLPLTRTDHRGAGASVALEAAACGKAVIATDTGGMRSFVRDGETGILVPPGDAGALRAAISLMSSNPALATRMGLAGRQSVEKRFSATAVNAGIEQHLLRVRGRSLEVVR